jgi:putative ABC transport system ATP-binding protein
MAMMMRSRSAALAVADIDVDSTSVPTYPHLVRPVPAARAAHAVKVYGSGETAVRALDGVDLEFARGGFTAIMGPSGSGKSTLLHCLAGLDTLTSGTIHIGDTALGTLRERQLTRLRRDRIGFIFQAFNLLPTLTAAENITLPLALAGRRPDQGWYDKVVDVVGLRDRLNHRPSELSGGQQQRVAAARALVSQPEIIFADEPTGNLDSKAGGELLAFMRRAVDAFDQTIVMVTHDPVAASYADRIVFLADGRVVDEMLDPTAERAIDHMKLLGE